MSDEQPIRILFVEDVPQDAELAQRVLRKEGLVFTSTRVETQADFLAALTTFQPDLIVSDYAMPEFDGMQALRLSLKDNAVRPFIVLTGSLNEETAVTCIKAGATDYVLKDRLARLPFAVKEALEQRQTRQAKEAAEQALHESEARYRLLFDTSMDAVLLTAPDGRIFAANRAACQMFGRTEAEITQIGRDGVVDNSDPRLALALDERIRTGSFTGEITLVRKEGARFPGEISSSIYHDTEGRVRSSMIIRDITGRKLAEEALRESREKYRRLFAEMMTGAALHEIVCDADGRAVDYITLEVNHAFESMLNVISQQVVGARASAVLPPAELAHWLEIFGTVALTGKSTRYEMYSPLNRKYFEGSAYCPAPGQFAVTFVDITERKRAEDALQQRVTELELLYENGLALSRLQSPGEIGQKIIDLLAQKLAWHHTTVRLYHPHDETLELLAFEQSGLASEVERRAVEERFKTLIARPGQGLSGWVVQHGQIVRSGNLARDPRYVETAPDLQSGLYVPMKVGERVIGVISVEDQQPDAFSEADERLTATLAAQAASALENARLFDEIRQRLTEMEALHTISAALRAAPSHAEMLPVIALLSFDVLKAAGTALVRREPATGETIVVFGHGAWVDRIGTRLPSGDGIGGYVIATGRTYLNNDAGDDPRLAPAERWGDLRAIAAAPLITQDQISGALIVGRSTNFDDEEVRLLAAIADIAANALQRAEVLETLEQRVADRTRELAAANERLQELDRLKSKFVSDVSHELRTPVTSLSLYIELLAHGKPGKREYYIAQLGPQVARLRAMIEEILDLSRLERDQREVGLTQIDLNSIVEHVVATQQAAAQAAGLQLTCEVAEQTPLVIVQPDQLSRAVANLVVNAIKYTRSGAVQVKTTVSDLQACIAVTDTGMGVAPEDVPHLFERFYRGKQVAQSAIPGTGLGLAIVKEIVEAHGGMVEVESAPGAGSTFRVWLPAVIG